MRLRQFVLSGVVLVMAGAGASAADLPGKAPRVPAFAAYNWTGFYVGGHLGYLQSRARLSDPATPGVDAVDTLKGLLGGAQIGYNYQFGALVAGVEADFSGTNADASRTVADGVGSVDRATHKARWTSTLTGRLGYAFDRMLVYAKGGAAFGGFSLQMQDLLTGASASTNYNRAGWTVGAGVEYALNANWTVRADYGYLAFANRNVTLPPSGALMTLLAVKHDMHLLKGGLNYRF